MTRSENVRNRQMWPQVSVYRMKGQQGDEEAPHES